MAILNDIRALFAQCPALKDLEARTDQLETDAGGTGSSRPVLPSSNRICAERPPGNTTLSLPLPA